jgi:predicted DNA-binding antitoxin AbrB/MazE fold protein
METFTVQAVYEKGVLKPTKKLNLPEHSVVEIKIKRTRSSRSKTAFASLIGVWQDLPKKESIALEKALANTRKRSASKVKRLTKSIK